LSIPGSAEKPEARPNTPPRSRGNRLLSGWRRQPARR
jgi:hypothetical protein